MMKIQVTDTFTEPTKADYAQLEKNGGRNAFADEVRRTVKDNGNINGCEINECKNNKNNEVTQIFIISEVSKLIQNVERKGKCISTEEALNRINPNFVKVFLDGKTPFNLDNYNANSKGKKKKGMFDISSSQRIHLMIVRDHLNQRLNKIIRFVQLIVNLPRSEILRSGHHTIMVQNADKETADLEIVNEYELQFLIILLMVESKMGKKSTEKKSYSWIHENVNAILFHEIRIALRSCNTKMSAILYNKFSMFTCENDEACDLLSQYKIGLFNPILLNNIKDEKIIKLTDNQNTFISQINNIVDKSVQSIKNNNEDKSVQSVKESEYLINIETYAQGKTTVGSSATSYALEKANKTLNKLIPSQSLVGIFTLPSLATAVAFAAGTAMDHPTWIIRDGKIIPLHAYCPHYKEQRGRKIIEKVEKFSENQGTLQKKYTDGINFKCSIFDQILQVINWNTNYTTRNYIGGKDKYILPIMIFADAKSTLQLNQFADKFKLELGWTFFNVIDEFVATADCNFDIRENQLLRKILDIINLRSSHSILMSASPTERQIRSSHIFKDSKMEFVKKTYTTRSFTQLYTNDGKSVHPLQALCSETFHIVRTWDDTDLRYFTPDTIIAIQKHLLNLGFEYNLTMKSCKSQNEFIQEIKLFLIYIDGLDIATKDSVCKLQINVPMPNIAKESSLTLTSGDLDTEILYLLNHKITHEIISRLFNEYKDNIVREIAEVRTEMSKAESFKEKSKMGSKDDLVNTRSNLENHLKNEQEHVINITTNLGSTQITTLWYETYGSKMTIDQLSVVLSGLEVELADETMNKALQKAYPRQMVVVDTIASMFGRNNHLTKNVIVKDPNHIMGFDTLKQALARAGRDGFTPVVTGIIDSHLLNLFQPHTRTSIKQMDVIVHGDTATKIQSMFRCFIVRRQYLQTIEKIIKIQSLYRGFIIRRFILKNKSTQKNKSGSRKINKKGKGKGKGKK